MDKTVKKCSKCKIEKEANSDNFAKRKSSKDGFDYMCKECKKAYDRVAWQKRKHKYDDFYKTRYDGNKEKFKAYSRKQYEENKEHYKKLFKKWSKNNPNKRKTINERRRSRENNIFSDLTNEEWEDTKKEFNFECAYCGISECEVLELYNEGLHQEHVIPIIRKWRTY